MIGFLKRKSVTGREGAEEPQASAAIDAKGAVKAGAARVAGPCAGAAISRALTLEGLRDADFAAIYAAGNIRVLEPGATLFRAGEKADLLYLLLKGKVALQGDTGVGTVVLADAGDWVGDLDFHTAEPYLNSAVAMSSASILALDRATYGSLDDRLKLRLVRHQQKAHRSRLSELSAWTGAIKRRNQALVEALYRLRIAGDTGFAKSDTVQGVIQKVPRLPVSTTTLLSKLFDERTTLNEVVELVKSDPSLAGILLKAINSPLYGLESKIDNVNRAVTQLGFDAVYQLIMSESMRKSLPETPQFLEIYNRSLETSHLAFTISQVTWRGNPVELFTIGLLNEIGSVVLELLKNQNPKLQRLLMTIDPAGLGAELLRTWKLPENLCKSIEYRHYPDFALPLHVPHDVLENVALLHLADCFYQRLHNSAEGREGLFTDGYIAALKLGDLRDPELLYQRVLANLRSRLSSLPRSLMAALTT